LITRGIFEVGALIGTSTGFTGVPARWGAAMGTLSANVDLKKETLTVFAIQLWRLARYELPVGIKLRENFLHQFLVLDRSTGAEVNINVNVCRLKRFQDFFAEFVYGLLRR
jgi:hypothetical protein